MSEEAGFEIMGIVSLSRYLARDLNTIVAMWSEEKCHQQHLIAMTEIIRNHHGTEKGIRNEK